MLTKLKQFFCNHRWVGQFKDHPTRYELTCKRCGRVDTWL